MQELLAQSTDLDWTHGLAMAPGIAGMCWMAWLQTGKGDSALSRIHERIDTEMRNNAEEHGKLVASLDKIIDRLDDLDRRQRN